jgi:hypothetical protein
MKYREVAKCPCLHASLVVFFVGLSICLIGCDRRSPTAPGPAPLGSASIHGEVNGVSAAASSVSTARGPAAGVGAVGHAQSVVAAAKAGAGVTVRVQGTQLSTVSDAQGAYRLDGVPGGDQILVFETAALGAALTIEDIAPHEDIELDVSLEDGNVRVDHMSRSGGDGEGIDVANLTLELAPDEWNLNFDRSSGTVEAFIRGEGIDEIDLDSFEMTGDDPEADPLVALGASRQGDHVRARFPKAEVLDLLLDPEPGSLHTITVSFTEEDQEDQEERLELTVEIVISNDDDDGGDDEPDLTLDIQPSNWNTNWRTSSGTVSALIRGTGFDSIDLDTIVMIGPAGELDPVSRDVAGNHVRARFSKSAAFGILGDADTGQNYTITVRFVVNGQTMDLPADIRTVGPAID